MDLKDLRYFVAAYEAKSFKGATDALGTVTSNVSMRIRGLEEFLGVPLFVRARRCVVPTAQGELLYGHAKNVIAKVEETERAVRMQSAA